MSQRARNQGSVLELTPADQSFLNLELKSDTERSEPAGILPEQTVDCGPNGSTPIRKVNVIVVALARRLPYGNLFLLSAPVKVQ